MADQIIAGVISAVVVAAFGLAGVWYQTRRTTQETRKETAALREQLDEVQDVLEKVDLTAIGKLFVIDRQYSDAISLLTSVIEQAPNPEALYFRGLAYSRTRRTAEAVADLDAAAEALPDNGEVRLSLARSLVALGRWRKAVDAANEAIKLGCSDVREAFVLWGDSLRRDGNLDTAIRVYGNGLERFRGDTRLIVGQGLALLTLAKLGRASFDEAVDHFDQAYESNPAAVVCLLNAAIARFLRNERDDREVASQQFEEYRERNPNDTQAWARPAILFIDLAEESQSDESKRVLVSEAVTLLTEAVARCADRYRPAVRNLLSYAYQLQGDYAEAVSQAEASVSENRTYPQNYQALCCAHLAAGNWGKAADSATTWLDSNGAQTSVAGRIWLRVFRSLARLCKYADQLWLQGEIELVNRDLVLLPEFSPSAWRWRPAKDRTRERLEETATLGLGEQVVSTIGHSF